MGVAPVGALSTAEVGITSTPGRFPSRVTSASAKPRHTPLSSVALPISISGKTANDERLLPSSVLTARVMPATSACG